jgi:carbamate kinase
VTTSERVVVALGGNAIAGERGADPVSQQRAVEGAAEQIAELVAHGYDIVITHGNGPQVGNLLLKNDLARDVVPPVPLDWCVAQTQAALGFLIAEGAIVVASGGGGIPMVRDAGGLRGVEAVLDKDLTGAVLARTVGATTFVVATHVAAAAIGYGTPEQEWLGAVVPGRLRALLDAGHFGSGSMEPKVRAALAFVEGGGARAVITSLERLREGVEGTVGTRVAA